MKKNILVIHGPNLNLIGEREPEIYGKVNINVINDEIKDFCKKNNADVEFFQSNIEGEIINKLHEARKNADGVIINAGAYTHYSIAIRDAIAAIKIPCIEVHLSNVFAREEFRTKTVIGGVCAGSISGFGKESYILALQGLLGILNN